MEYDDAIIEAVWQKADPTPDPELRLDYCCRALIRRDRYGDRDSDFDWVVAPRDLERDVPDLVPLHWANNDSRQFGRFVCVKTANQLLTANTDTPPSVQPQGEDAI